MTRKTVAFILSEDRSGSTWVGYVLGSSAQSAFLGEYYRAWRKDLSQPCLLCSARGRSTCEVLSGIEEIPVEDAFSWAFARTGKLLLVDSSKTLDWVTRFLGQSSNYNIRLIHIIRDPRGWYSSQRRRTPGHYQILIKKWYETNIRIREFVEHSGHPYIAVYYDEISAMPSRQFKKIFRFCGIRFHSACLEYWRVPHHCFAANGASSFLLTEEQFGRRLPHFVTGDDAFYESNSRRLFIDTRWTEDLNVEELEGIAGDPRVIELLSIDNRRLTPGGLAEIPRTSLAAASIPFVGRLVRKVFGPSR